MHVQELRDRLGLDEEDSVWQCKVRELPAHAGTPVGAKDSGWVPFCMF